MVSCDWSVVSSEWRKKITDWITILQQLPTNQSPLPNGEENLKLNAMLFDLDNTLILFEEAIFFQHYSKKLYLSFQDLMTPQQFGPKLIHSTQSMIRNNGEKTNAEFFVDDFANGMAIDKKALWQRFEKFYANEFEQFQTLMKPLDGAREIISKLQQMGLKLVIASNPMFPMNVQLMRLKWAGLGDIEFDLVTSADNTSFVKPRLEYYQHICETIRVKPEHCLMVGNDGFNDMISSKIGMKTYLTTDSDHLSIDLSRELAKDVGLEMPAPDFKGPLKDVIIAVENLSAQ